MRYKNFLYNEDGRTLEQVSQRGGRCPVNGNTQGQVGGALNDLIWLKMSLHTAGGWTRGLLKVASNLSCSVNVCLFKINCQNRN